MIQVKDVQLVDVTRNPKRSRKFHWKFYQAPGKPRSLPAKYAYLKRQRESKTFKIMLIFLAALSVHVLYYSWGRWLFRRAPPPLFFSPPCTPERRCSNTLWLLWGSVTSALVGDFQLHFTSRRHCILYKSTSLSVFLVVIFNPFRWSVCPLVYFTRRCVQSDIRTRFTCFHDENFIRQQSILSVFKIFCSKR